MAGARREDQRVVADLAPIENEAARGEFHSRDLGEQHRDVLGASQDGAERRRDVGRVQRSGRDLIEQGLKQVVVAPVEQGDAHRCPGKPGDRLQAAESAADDDNAMPALGPGCYRRAVTRWKIIGWRNHGSAAL